MCLSTRGRFHSSSDTFLVFLLPGDKAMSRYFTIKVTVQAMSLLACAILQVYLLRTLFEKKFARSFV